MSPPAPEADIISRVRENGVGPEGLGFSPPVVAVGLGTDGANLDMFEDMDTAAKVPKLFRGDPMVLPAKTALRDGGLGDARALEKRSGSLEAGKLAAVVLVDGRQPSLVPLYDEGSDPGEPGPMSNVELPSPGS